MSEICRTTAKQIGFAALLQHLLQLVADVEVVLDRALAATMKAAGKIFEPVIYDSAGHGFMRAGEAPDANEANRRARDEAWARWKKLLGSGQ